MRYRIYWMDCGCAWLQLSKKDTYRRARVRTCAKHQPNRPTPVSKPRLVPAPLTAAVHVEGKCEHNHTPPTTPVISRLDSLPWGMSREIYQEFKDKGEFKSLDVTNEFGQSAGTVMKELREKNLVSFEQPCGKGTHFIHWFTN